MKIVVFAVLAILKVYSRPVETQHRMHYWRDKTSHAVKVGAKIYQEDSLHLKPIARYSVQT